MGRKIFIIVFIIPILFCNKESKSQESKIHIGNLIAQKNLNFDYVEGDIIDCKNISIRYLKGDIRGEKNQNIIVDVMRGNVQSGNAKINILEGNIINGKSVSVRLLIGIDFSNQAIINQQIKPKIEF